MCLARDELHTVIISYATCKKPRRCVRKTYADKLKDEKYMIVPTLKENNSLTIATD
jgi:hypothetical protein